MFSRVFPLVAACSLQLAYAVDGTKLFEYSFGKPLQTAPSVDHDGTIFVGGQGSIAAVSSSGEQKWKISLTPNSTATIGGITIASDRIYITSSQGLFAYTKAGTPLWSTNWNTANSSVALGHGQENYVVDTEANLRAFLPDGSSPWSTYLEPTLPIHVLQPGPVVGSDGTIYAALGRVYAINSAGEALWTNKWEVWQPPVIHENGTIYVSEGMPPVKTVHSFAADGSTNWSKSLQGGSPGSLSMAPDGTLFLGTLPDYWHGSDGFVALGPVGEVKWNDDFPCYVTAAVVSDGTVFVAGEGKIAALTAPGQVRWTFTNGVQVVKGLSIGLDNSIYASQADGVLLALRGSSPLPDKGWPVLGKDHRNSSRQRLSIEFQDFLVDQVTSNSSRLSLKVNPQGTETTLFIEYSSDSSTNRSVQVLAATNNLVPVVAELSPLAEGTFYRTRVIASNEFTFASSAEIRFRTAGAPSPVAPTLETLQAAAQTGGVLAFSESGVITTFTPIEITSDLEIDANGHDVVFSGNGTSSILRLSTNTQLTLRGLSLINGRAQGKDSLTNPLPGQGGAIVNLGGSLSLINCTLSNNVAIGAANLPSPSPSIPYLPVSEPAALAAGGAIWQAGGVLFVKDTRFITNTAVGSMYSRATARGGAIFLNEESQAHITNTVFIGNRVQAGENGFQNSGAPRFNADGGAIYAENSSLELVGSSLLGNQTSVGLGLARGAGLYLTNGLLTITNSVFAENQAKGGGNGGRGYWSGLPAYGGAIYIAGPAKIHRSTFSRNLTVGGLAEGGRPGGDSIGGAIYNSSSLELVNSTLTGNSALKGLVRPSEPWDPQRPQLPGEGSAVYTTTPIGITNSTIAFNFGATNALSSDYASITLKNTILAFNTEQNGGTNIIDAGHNISSDATPAFTESTSRNNLDPMLGPLGFYGGPTQVFPVIVGSPAIDAGDNSAAPGLDQRGRVRPYGAHADIGAFESSAPFYVWGKIGGYYDPTTEMHVEETTFTPESDGSYILGPLPAGAQEIQFTAENAHFRPNPWTFNLTADASLSEVKSFEIHTFTYDGTPADPVFTLAGLPGEVYHIDASLDLQSWVPLDTFTVDQTGLISIPVTNNAPTLYLRPIQQHP